MTVQIVNLNGPRGGKDTACRIEVRLLPTGNIFIEETDADLHAAVDRAADRAARSVSRAINRTRHLQRDTATAHGPRLASTPSDTKERPAAL